MSLSLTSSPSVASPLALPVALPVESAVFDQRADPPISLARGGTYKAAQVSEAFNEVKRAFNDGTVWSSELKSVAAAVSKLQAQERRSLVNNLANAASGPTSLLARWLGEVTARGVGAFDGLDAGARAALFVDLIDGQDAKNLERIFHALKDGRSGTWARQSEVYQAEFMTALQRHGSSEQRLGFIGRMSDNAIRGNAAAARGIGQLIASSRSAADLDRAFALLDRPATDAVVAAALQPRSQLTTSTFGGSTVHVTTDPAPFAALAEATRQASSQREKASFVAAAGQVIETLRGPGRHQGDYKNDLATVVRGISKVIGSDVSGVIDNTLLQTAAEGNSSGRKALKQYVRASLELGRGQDLFAVTLSLQRGPRLSTDATHYLGLPTARSGEAANFHNARLLGEWLGVVAAAVQSTTSERDRNAASGALLFNGGADLLKETVGNYFPGIKFALAGTAAIIKPIVNTAILNWRTQLAAGDKQFVQRLYDAALPRHPSGVEATAEWVTTLNAHYFGALQRT